MNSLDFRKAIDEFLGGLDDVSGFLEYIQNLSDYSGKISSHLEVIANGGSSRFNEAANGIHAHFSNLTGIAAKISHRQFYRELDLFINSLNEINNKLSEDSSLSIFDIVIKKLEDFSNSYDEYVKVRNAIAAKNILIITVDLNSRINTLIETLRAVNVALMPSGVLNSEYAQISIVLPEHYSLKDFAERLLALQSMYSELCALFDVNENDHPLRIGKVESGSLWAWLFGDTKIIELISTFIKQGASFAYRNFTTEGKISALPKKMETIDAMLNLTQRLEAAGFNTAEMKPNIEKAAFAISRDLTILIDGQPSITVNDEKLSLNEELTKALLERSDVRLLQSKPEQKPDEGPAALPE